MVLVPQSLSYAKLAQLPPEYGLYSSFIGVLTYAFFATSKDVSIGPVAVMSLATGNIVIAVQDKFGDLYTAPQIATCLAFICGFAVLAIGLLRIGWLVEFSKSLPTAVSMMFGADYPSSPACCIWFYDRKCHQYRCWSDPCIIRYQGPT
jgi:sodium-independent sulfate anion transporter 11